MPPRAPPGWAMQRRTRRDMAGQRCGAHRADSLRRTCAGSMPRHARQSPAPQRRPCGAPRVRRMRHLRARAQATAIRTAPLAQRVAARTLPPRPAQTTKKSPMLAHPRHRGASTPVEQGRNRVKAHQKANEESGQAPGCVSTRMCVSVMQQHRSVPRTARRIDERQDEAYQEASELTRRLCPCCAARLLCK